MTEKCGKDTFSMKCTLQISSKNTIKNTSFSSIYNEIVSSN